MNIIKKCFMLLGFFFLLILPGESRADDMSIFDVDASIRPNILVIFDNSTSMKYPLPYDYTQTYPGPYETCQPRTDPAAPCIPVIYFQACCYDQDCSGGGSGPPQPPVCLPGRECSIFDLFDPQNLLANFWGDDEAHAAFHCGTNDEVNCWACLSGKGAEVPFIDSPFHGHKYCCTPVQEGSWKAYSTACTCRGTTIVVNGVTYIFGNYHYEKAGTQTDFQDVNYDGQDDRIDLNTENIIRRYTGNYLNYVYQLKLNHGKTVQNRYDAAKAAIASIVDNYYQQVNFGLMVFDKSENNTSASNYLEFIDGGKVLVEIANPTTSQQMENQKTALMNALNGGAQPGARMFTPLAEALADAGRYYRGTFTNFHNGKGGNNPTNLDSPIKDYCQGNFVIIVTDGEPTCDSDKSVLSFLLEPGNAYYKNLEPSTPPIVRDPDNLTFRKYASTGRTHANIGFTGDNQTEIDEGKIYYHYLDNVALYLYDKDMCAESGANGRIPGCRPNQQGNSASINIKTFVIGFGIGNEILRSAALWGTGGTLNAASRPEDERGFYRAGGQISLENALRQIISLILRQPFIFTNVALQTKQITTGDALYIPYAIPVEKTGGDLKKWGIVGGELKDRNGAAATDSSGKFTGTPYWSANDEIKAQVTAITRKIYTAFQTGPIITAGTTSGNIFAKTNPAVNNETALRMSDRNTRDKVIDFITGLNIDVDPRVVRTNVLGSILHSTPLLVNYWQTADRGANQTPPKVIYVGANDGMLHAINEANGRELWAFIPKELLGTLNKLALQNDRQYFVDGSPKLVTLDSTGKRLLHPDDPAAVQKILVFGLRRGGSNYYGLDVTDKDNPSLLWTVSPQTPGFGRLGQSWSEPVFGQVKNGDGNSLVVGFIGGGFDPDYSASKKSYWGNAFYAFDVRTGSHVWSVAGTENAGTKYKQKMTYSIPSNILAYDANNDGYVDRLYVGDLGGQLWIFTDLTDGQEGNPQISQWEARLLFDTRSGGNSGGNNGNNSHANDRRIFYPPDLVRAEGKYFLYFGTGDREDPRDTTVINQFYCVKDPRINVTSMDQNNLLNLTNDISPKPADLVGKQGWYITLENLGEKALARPKVYSGNVFFTTFTPSAGTCEVGGTPRMYAVNYLKGVPVLDLANPVTPPPTSPTLNKDDRSKPLVDLGGIPGEVAIVIQTGSGGLGANTFAPSGLGLPSGGRIPQILTLIPYSWKDKGANPN
jgi:type IV pilus assembly protein PilY1